MVAPKQFNNSYVLEPPVYLIFINHDDYTDGNTRVPLVAEMGGHVGIHMETTREQAKQTADLITEVTGQHIVVGRIDKLDVVDKLVDAVNRAQKESGNKTIDGFFTETAEVSRGPEGPKFSAVFTPFSGILQLPPPGVN